MRSRTNDQQHSSSDRAANGRYRDKDERDAYREVGERARRMIEVVNTTPALNRSARHLRVALAVQHYLTSRSRWWDRVTVEQIAEAAGFAQRNTATGRVPGWARDRASESLRALDKHGAITYSAGSGAYAVATIALPPAQAEPARETPKHQPNRPVLEHQPNQHVFRREHQPNQHVFTANTSRFSAKTQADSRGTPSLLLPSLKDEEEEDDVRRAVRGVACADAPATAHGAAHENDAAHEHGSAVVDAVRRISAAVEAPVDWADPELASAVSAWVASGRTVDALVGFVASRRLDTDRRGKPIANAARYLARSIRDRAEAPVSDVEVALNGTGTEQPGDEGPMTARRVDGLGVSYGARLAPLAEDDDWHAVGQDGDLDDVPSIHPDVQAKLDAIRRDIDELTAAGVPTSPLMRQYADTADRMIGRHPAHMFPVDDLAYAVRRVRRVVNMRRAWEKLVADGVPGARPGDSEHTEVTAFLDWIDAEWDGTVNETFNNRQLRPSLAFSNVERRLLDGDASGDRSPQADGRAEASVAAPVEAHDALIAEIRAIHDKDPDRLGKITARVKPKGVPNLRSYTATPEQLEIVRAAIRDTEQTAEQSPQADERAGASDTAPIEWQDALVADLRAIAVDDPARYSELDRRVGDALRALDARSASRVAVAFVRAAIRDTERSAVVIPLRPQRPPQAAQERRTAP